MSQPMTIDFMIVAESKPASETCRDALRARGFLAEITGSDEEGWDVACAVSLIPDYAQIIRIQQEIEDIVGPLGGAVDGWGTYGNAGASTN